MLRFLIVFLIIFNFSCSAISKEENPYFYYVMCKYAQYNKDYKSAEELCEKVVSLLPETRKAYQEVINILQKEGKTDKYLKYLKIYSEKFHKPEDFLFIAKKYEQINKFDDALNVLEKAKKLYPDNPDISAYLADIYSKKKDVEKMESQLKELLKNPKFKNKAGAYFLLAKLEIMRGNFQKAEEYLKKAFQLNKKSPEIYVFLAELYKQKGKYKKAEEVYLEVLKENPNSFEALNRLFQLYVDTDQYEKAKKIIDKLATLNPSGKDVLLKQFYLYLKLKKVKDLVPKLEKLVKSHPNDPQILMILGMAYESVNNLEKAEEIYERVLKLQPNNQEAFDRLMSVLINQKKYRKAIDLLNKKYAENPKNYNVLVMMAEIEDLRGNTEEAVKLIKEAISINPKNEKLYFYLGIYLDKLDRWEEAEKALKKAIQLRPDFHDALNYLGYSYILRDIDVDKGIQLVKKALKYAPDNPAYLDSLAWGYYKKGKYNEALNIMLKVVNKINDDPVVFYHYGAILEALGEKKKAKEIYEKALKLLEKMKEEPEKGLKEKIKEEPEKGIKEKIKERLKNLKW